VPHESAARFNSLIESSFSLGSEPLEPEKYLSLKGEVAAATTSQYKGIADTIVQLFRFQILGLIPSSSTPSSWTCATAANPTEGESWNN
jgi:hypothetical protein